MKIYRFAVHPREDKFHFLECINDPHLYTQARSMDEALLMARDVIECMYDEKNVIVEFVVPPDVSTAYERKWQERHRRRLAAKRSRATSPRRGKTKKAA